MRLCFYQSVDVMHSITELHKEEIALKMYLAVFDDVFPYWIMFLGFGLMTLNAHDFPRNLSYNFPGSVSKHNQNAVSISFSYFFSCGLSSFSFFYLVILLSYRFRLIFF